MANAPRGRRPGDPSETRETIVSAARAMFAKHGFDKASVRKIAAEAGVDPALINHHFGSKQKLFVAAMRAPVNPVEVVQRLAAEGPDKLGFRIAETFVSVWDSPAGSGLAQAMRGALAQDGMTVAMREFVTHQILPAIASALDAPAPEKRVRASLVASQLIGLAVTRYILRIEPLASASPEAVVGSIGPVLQGYLTGSAVATIELGPGIVQPE
ncbi:TetR/AcrR family transcriptional regulator [Hoyosella subflava]|uniref:Transcriptional regulator, TetR family n=1 Tax=Hoyosella subflava (strain DSM 45089 / JCM 17490 / NBRC 109087 / DQS3-9A1) TaxID=443218 RepID=F6ES38_HOYSD|nr:TetR family transcriptional regulator [Hoyosella subflava]AEF42042.1 Transcriptional regulator, TetR family [Hoyosella subflava DQS3-9A1]